MAPIGAAAVTATLWASEFDARPALVG